MASLLLSFLCLSPLVRATTQSLGSISDPNIKGLTARYFAYESNDQDYYENISYLAYGYSFGNPVAQKTGVNKVSFSSSDPTSLIENMQHSNTTVSLTGYFKPDVSGEYMFSLYDVSDTAVFFFGDGIAFKMDQQNCLPYTTTFSIAAVDSWAGFLTNYSNNYTVKLNAGDYYPMRIVYTNINPQGSVSFNIRLPNGEVMTDFDGYFFSSLNALEDCSTNSILNATPVMNDLEVVGSVNEKFNSPSSNSESEIYNEGPLVIYRTMGPRSGSTTTTSGYDGSVTTTYSTSYYTFYGTDLLETIETVYYVETPTGVSETTRQYDGSTTNTYATSYVTLGSNHEYQPNMVNSETPVARSTTTTRGYDGLVTTTYSTSYYTLYGTDRLETIETVYYVETPHIHSNPLSTESVSTKATEKSFSLHTMSSEIQVSSATHASSDLTSSVFVSSVDSASLYVSSVTFDSSVSSVMSSIRTQNVKANTISPTLMDKTKPSDSSYNYSNNTESAATSHVYMNSTASVVPSSSNSTKSEIKTYTSDMSILSSEHASFITSTHSKDEVYTHNTNVMSSVPTSQNEAILSTSSYSHNTSYPITTSEGFGHKLHIGALFILPLALL